MHYLVFLPRRNEGPKNDLNLAQRLTAAGLADHATDGTPIFQHEGPSGEPGFCVGWGNTSTKLNVRPDEQTWLQSVPRDGVEAGAYWVGIWDDSPPTEGELRRPYTQAGKFVQLGDDKWKIPTPDSVDKYAAYNDDGSMRWETVRQFAWLCDEAVKLREEFLAPHNTKLATFATDPSEFVAWLLKLMRVNYRITPEVAAHLELWRASTLADAVLSSLGLQVAGGADG